MDNFIISDKESDSLADSIRAYLKGAGECRTIKLKRATGALIADLIRFAESKGCEGMAAQVFRSLERADHVEDVNVERSTKKS